MVSPEISDRKPGLLTALQVLVTFALAGVIVALVLYGSQADNGYDTTRPAERYKKLKALNEQNSKKAKDYAVLNQEKGVYQLPIENAMELTARDLAKIAPHAAYPIPKATPTPAVSPAPAASPATAVSPAPAAAPSPEAAPSATPQAGGSGPSPAGSPIAPAPGASPAAPDASPAAAPAPVASPSTTPAP